MTSKGQGGNRFLLVCSALGLLLGGSGLAEMSLPRTTAQWGGKRVFTPFSNEGALVSSAQSGAVLLGLQGPVAKAPFGRTGSAVRSRGEGFLRPGLAGRAASLRDLYPSTGRPPRERQISAQTSPPKNKTPQGGNREASSFDDRTRPEIRLLEVFSLSPDLPRFDWRSPAEAVHPVNIPLRIRALLDGDEIRRVRIEYLTPGGNRGGPHLVLPDTSSSYWSWTIPARELREAGILSLSLLAEDGQGNQRRVVAALRMVKREARKESLDRTLRTAVFLTSIIGGIAYWLAPKYLNQEPSVIVWPQSPIPKPPPKAN